MTTQAKQNAWLGGILVGLIVLAVLYQGPYRQWQVSRSEPINVFSGIQTDDINRMTIEVNGKTIELIKKDNGWEFPDQAHAFPLEQSFVVQAIDRIKAAAKAKVQLVSTKKEKQSEFGVGSEGSTVKLFQDNKEKVAVVIGSTAKDYVSTYLRPIKDDNTYKLDGISLAVFYTPDWRSKEIVKFDVKSINNARLQTPKSEIKLTKTGEDWFAGKVKLNKIKVESLLSTLSNLFAADIPEQKFEPSGLAKSSLIIQVGGKDANITVMVGNKNSKGEFYVKTGDSDRIYLIGGGDQASLSKNLNELK
ncbi:MAG: DUF4340 domain-containing protein [Candidatus Falkowbacteria bacterium]